MNTPGPFYCGETNNCGTGPLAAPNNVGVDEDGFEVIYRQPVNRYELRQMLEAAWADPFAGYAVDGDAHWTYETVKAWWAEPRCKVEQELQRLYEAQGALRDKKNYEYISMLARWLAYLKDDMCQYLQVYAFFWITDVPRQKAIDCLNCSAVGWRLKTAPGGCATKPAYAG